MKQSRAFILKQVRAFSELGYSEEDIARTLRWTEAHLPQGADEATWVPTAQDLTGDAVLTDADVEDAIRALKLSKSTSRLLKRLLDAAEEP